MNLKWISGFLQDAFLLLITEFKISLPTPGWFEDIDELAKTEEITTDSGISGCSKTCTGPIKRKKPRKLKKTFISSTSKNDEIIEISDGEDLLTVFPLDSTNKTTINYTTRHEKMDDGFQYDDDDDLVVLFEQKSTSSGLKKVNWLVS